MKKLLCLLVCLVLLTGLLPVTALADSNPVPNAAQAVVCIVSGIGYQGGKPRVFICYLKSIGAIW